MKKNEIEKELKEKLRINNVLQMEGSKDSEISDDIYEMKQKVDEYYDKLDEFRKSLLKKRYSDLIRVISKDEKNKKYKIEQFEMESRTERFCNKFDENNGCKIDLSEHYSKYEPKNVFGENLARSHLLSSYWSEPDLDLFKGKKEVYKGLWHSNNKKDILPHHDIGNDEHRIVDRCSFYGQYPVYKGRPLNPVARTGFRGRGVLSHWGPNKVVGAILYIKDDDLNKFEFLGIENNKYEKKQYITTPGGFVDLDEEFVDASRRELLEEAFDLEKERDKKEFEKMSEIIGGGELVIFGNTELNPACWTEKKEDKQVNNEEEPKYLTQEKGQNVPKNVRQRMCFNDKSQNKNETKKICYRLNAERMFHMKDIAYFYLVKKYNEKDFLDTISEKKKFKSEEIKLSFNEEEENFMEAREYFDNEKEDEKSSLMEKKMKTSI
uniref:Nudix hydrolase domain-containing protein n=1 Tax=Meloidogyne hapla TaxID=6305 RepID=A0A1I8BR00_MELHA